MYAASYEDFPLEDISGIENPEFFFVLYVIYLLIVMGWGVLVYCLQSASFYTIAKRREIKKPWLSWVPLVNVWILGSIADQYQYVVNGRIRNKRKALLAINIILTVILVLFFVAYGALIFQIIDKTGTDFENWTPGHETIVTVIAILALALAMVGFAIAETVIQYMALSNLFYSCDPSNSVMYLVLSIFINVTQPFFLFACRKKDLGMPPRKDAMYQVPVQQPAAPVYQAYHENREWQPPIQQPAVPTPQQQTAEPENHDEV